MPTLSTKQEQAYLQSLARINLFHGSVRSGKTFSSLLRFAYDLRHAPRGDFLISGVTRETIQRNLGSDFARITGIDFPPVHSNFFKIWGRPVHILGASDLQAERKIQGSTLAGAYVDEAALLPESFFKMLLSRLSVTGAKLLATMNPASPYHWIKTQYIDREHELDLKSFHFILNDNPSLSEHYKTNLSKEYTGLWFKRYIEGLWVLAEGVIYDCFNDERHVILAPPRPAQYHVIGVDVGTTNPTSFVCLGYHPEASPPLWCEKEYYYNSKREGATKAYSEYAEDFIDFIDGLNVRGIYIDPSAAAFIAELRKLGVQNIYDADNDVLNGIQTQYTYLRDGTYKICACCLEVRKEYGSYMWDTKASDRGIDKPIKEHDHCFTGDTLVLTPSGNMPIKDIKKGDLVITDKGIDKVFGTWESLHPQDLVKLVIDGTETFCTPNHGYYTENRGKIEASSLTSKDTLFTIKPYQEALWKKKLLYGMEENIIGIQENVISNFIDGIYTGTFGDTIGGQYLTDIIYTTLIETQPITPLRILSVSQEKNKELYTINNRLSEAVGLCKIMAKELEKLQRNGIEVKRVGLGIGSTRNIRLIEIQKFQSVPTVSRSTQLFSVEDSQSSAPISVNQRIEELQRLITLRRNVLCVESNIPLIAIKTKSHVQEVVQQSTDGLKEKVYNLTTEKYNRYLANNQLVSNCMDAQRYPIYTFFRKILGSKTSSKQELEERYNRVMRQGQKNLPRFFQETSFPVY